MFDFDAIEASIFREKIKVVFLFLKLKIVTVQQLKERADAVEKKFKLKIFNAEMIK
jgi:hypothetical protein